MPQTRSTPRSSRSRSINASRNDWSVIRSTCAALCQSSGPAWVQAILVIRVRVPLFGGSATPALCPDLGRHRNSMPLPCGEPTAKFTGLRTSPTRTPRTCARWRERAVEVVTSHGCPRSFDPHLRVAKQALIAVSTVRSGVRSAGLPLTVSLAVVSHGEIRRLAIREPQGLLVGPEGIEPSTRGLKGL